MVMDSLEASDRGANHVSPGDAQWHRTLVRACLECQIEQPWPRGEYLNRAVCYSVHFATVEMNKTVTVTDSGFVPEVNSISIVFVFFMLLTHGRT